MGIQLTPEWTRYFIENNPIITECTYFKLTQFLQQKNPSVPAISEKLIQPTSRNSLDFSRAKDYWRSAIERDGDVYDIYTLRHFTKDALESLGPMSVDHFVPWKFVLHDQIWNLVPTFRSPNSSKNDNLPDTAYLDDFCSVQFIGLTANRETQHFRKVIESYRDVIPNASSSSRRLKTKKLSARSLKTRFSRFCCRRRIKGSRTGRIRTAACSSASDMKGDCQSLMTLRRGTVDNVTRLCQVTRLVRDQSPAWR